MLRKLWDEFRSQVAVSMLISIVGALAAAALASIWTYGVYAATALGVPAAAGAGLLGFFVVIGALNQMQDMDSRAQRRRLARRTPGDVEKQVWDWLKKFKYAVQEKTDPAGHHFSVSAQDDQGVIVTIAMFRDQPWVMALGGVDIEDGLARRLATVPNFREEMAIQLLHLGIEYKLDVENGAIIRVHFQTRLVFDENTHALQLLDAIRAVRAAITLFAAQTRKLRPAEP